MPVGAETFSDALRWGTEVFHTLKGVLEEEGYNTAHKTKGGFAPSLKSNDEALDLIMDAIEKAGYTPGEQIAIALDPASSEFYNKETGKYVFKNLTSANSLSAGDGRLLGSAWVNKHPIVSIEDGLAEDDWAGWAQHDRKPLATIQLVGDDLFGHQHAVRLPAGDIEQKCANSIPDLSAKPDRHHLQTLEASSSSAAALDTPASSATAPARRKIPLSPTSP